RVAILEVDIEGTTRVAGAGTDRVEARRVETAVRDLGEGRVEERIAGGRLGGGPGSGRAGHGAFLTYECVCWKSRFTYRVLCEDRAMTPTIAPVRGLAIETARIWALHLLCFVLPITSLLFGVTAPHPWYGAWPWLGVVVASVVADGWSAGERRQPAAMLPG